MVYEELIHSIFAIANGSLVIQNYFQKEYQVQKKFGGSPVTEADLASHHKIFSIIKEFYPKDDFLSEEDDSRITRTSASRKWILDPLDGTKSFIAGIPEFAISLGLVEQNKPILGVICNPITNEIFWSKDGFGLGYGVFKDSNLENYKVIKDRIEKFLILSKQNLQNKINSTLNANTNKKIQVLVSRTEFQDKILNPLIQNKNFQDQYEVRPIGSIAYKLGLLGASFGDCIVSLRPKNSWDVCAGIAYIQMRDMVHFFIREEKEINFNGTEPSGCGFIAGPKSIINEFWSEFKTLLKSNLCC